MGNLKLLLQLNPRCHLKTSSLSYLISTASLQYRHLQFFSVRCSLKIKHSSESAETLQYSESSTDDDDYFGVQYYSSIRKEEEASEKEAWLRDQKLSKAQSGNESLTKNQRRCSVEEDEQYKSELVKRLVNTASDSHKPREISVKKAYGTIRYDRKMPLDIVEQQFTVKKENQVDEVWSNKIKSNRFSNSTLRESLRAAGSKFQMTGNERKRSRNVLNDISLPQKDPYDGAEESLTSYIDDQYFRYDSDKQIDTMLQTDMDKLESEARAKKYESKECNVELDMDSEVSSEDCLRETAGLSYIDKQYFNSCSGDEMNDGEESSFLARSGTDLSADLSFVDQQYFRKQTDKDSDAGEMFSQFERSKNSLSDIVARRSKGRNVNKSSKPQDYSGVDFIDNQHFGYDLGVVEDKTMKRTRKGKAKKGAEQSAFVANSETLSETDEQSVDSSIDASYAKAIRSITKEDFAITRKTERDGKKKLPQEVAQSSLMKKDPEMAKNPETAFEVAMQKRAEFNAERGRRLYGQMNPRERDQQGFRILKGQVPDFTNIPSHDIADFLRQNIIYDNHEIVAINKPYGLPILYGSGTKVSVEHLLSDILPSTTLHLVIGIGKETTGVVLLAKTPYMARELQEAFNWEECVKRYLLITKNVPTLPKGEINIPIADAMVDGKVRKTLKPYGDSDMGISSKLSKNAERAITRYEVLHQRERCALIECQPLTNVRHQIRAHLAFGLNCPILGDHKYSHLDRIAPMKLHPELLNQLYIRQSKVRDVAMHIHARSVVIPEFLNGQNLIVSAPLPAHFIKNMKTLKLKLPPRK